MHWIHSIFQVGMLALLAAEALAASLDTFNSHTTSLYNWRAIMAFTVAYAGLGTVYWSMRLMGVLWLRGGKKDPIEEERARMLGGGQKGKSSRMPPVNSSSSSAVGDKVDSEVQVVGSKSNSAESAAMGKNLISTERGAQFFFYLSISLFSIYAFARVAFLYSYSDGGYRVALDTYFPTSTALFYTQVHKIEFLHSVVTTFLVAVLAFVMSAVSRRVTKTLTVPVTPL